jgi:aldose 1-epimerase
MTHLIHENSELVLSPKTGGVVVSLTLDGIEIIRSGPATPQPNWAPLDYGSFPLVPFSGRIASGRFNLGGKDILLPANFPPEPHAIHGHGWQSEWTVIDSGLDFAELSYKHQLDAWPWEYEATQRFLLENDRLALELSLTNKSDTAMPAGIGWHPYFPRENAILELPTESVWLSDENIIPRAPEPVLASMDLRSGRRVEQLDLDYAFDVSRSEATIRYPEHIVTLRADSKFTKSVVYVPPNENYFCVEPVTHSPDAINSDLPTSITGLEWLKSGETLSGRIELLVKR